MLTLFRGGPAMWLAVSDAERIGVADNDWLEVYNRHGVGRLPRRGQPPGAARGRRSSTTPRTAT